MERTILNVEGMSCSHCVDAITKAIRGLEGISNVDVDLDAKTVTVGYDIDKVTLVSIKDAIEEQGYDVIL